MTEEGKVPVLLDALRRVAAAMDESGRPHVFIGGIALAAWGKVRTTVDIDLMIFGPEHEAEQIVAALSAAGFSLETKIERDVMMSGFRMRKIYQQSGNTPPELSVPLDVLLSSNPVVEQITANARQRQVGGVVVKVPRAEDFIVLKLQAGRMQDLADAQAVYRLLKDSLNREYLESLARQFAVAERLEQVSAQE